MTNKQFIDELELKTVYIYGAGTVGGLVFKRLVAKGVKQDSIYFVVSEAACNQQYMNRPVIGISEYIASDNNIIIVATLKKNHNQIVKMLERHNIDTYIVVDSELYEDLESEYVEDYLRCNPVAMGNRQILFMASDNNSSSGAFLCLVDLNIELNKRGIKTLVILPMYGTGESLLQENNIDFTYVLSKDWLGEIGEPIRDLASNEKAINMLVSFIKDFGIQLVHINTTYSYVGAVAAKRAGVPYVWHIREYIKEQGFWFYDEKKSYGMINGAECIIPVSNYVGKCYSGLDKEKFHIVYDGVDVKRFYEERNIFQNEEISILMPGTLIPLKGQRQMVEAAHCLRDKDIKFNIAFIGKGDADYINEIKLLVDKYGLEDVISFVERTNEIEKWYKKSDIVVICSRAEAFGRVTVEAQLSGCLVIGAKCGATEEIIKDNKTGIFYELDNYTDLAEKIVWAVSHKELSRQIATEGRTFARNVFSKENNADGVIGIYDSIIGKNKLYGM